MIRIIGLAGRRGAGKTTLAAALEREGGFVRASFGDYVRSLATSQCIADDTVSLEGLGTKLIADLGWERFCAGVLKGTESAARVVVDGIRHCAARDTIRRLAYPDGMALVFVDTNDDLRRQRLSQRLGRDNPQGREGMSEDFDELRRQADLVVDGALADAAGRVLRWLESTNEGCH